MRRINAIKVGLAAAGVAAACVIPAASANASTVRPNTMYYIASYSSMFVCDAVAIGYDGAYGEPFTCIWNGRTNQADLYENVG